MVRFMDYSIAILIVAAIGFILSAYSLYIEKRKEMSESYKAVCDFNDRFSCTKTFTSEYGKMFGIRNSLSGIGYYIVIFGLVWFGFTNYAFYISILSILYTIYLAYAAYFKLKSYCVICHSIYLVNIILIVMLYLNL